ncbi:Perforin-1 [Labeo rohita]|uniref:Perforin-1 n=1 Tax=Labeo rohita TaxID=84645 RepID=A0ABQ8MH08_LABRO|nr:Perforin-1 [Labeo rohita]
MKNMCTLCNFPADIIMETNRCVFHAFLCIFTHFLILTHWGMSSACHTGSHDECEKVPFVPGYNLAGEGFDVVSMRRKGAFLINVKSHVDNGTCTVCKNRFQGGQMQKLPSVVRDWLQHPLINKWEMGLSLDDIGKAILGGSRSDIAQFAKFQNAMDNYRVTEHPELSTEFSKHLQQLPKQYDVKTKPLYRRTIDTYGTHYIRQVHLGGRVRRVTAFRTCFATLMGFSETDIKNCLNFELKIILGFLPANAYFYNKCSQILKDNMGMGFHRGFMTHKTEVLGGEKYFPDLVLNQSPAEAYSNWMKSLHDNPEVISYAVSPLYHLVADPEISANLKRAITEYIEDNMLSVNDKENQECSQKPNLDHNCCPIRARRGKLVVFVLGATGMNEDYFSATDGFVKIWYNDMYKETEVVLNNNDPEWNTIFDFGSIEFGHELIFEVWDSDVKYDDFVGRCVVRPESGPETHLYSCPLQRGIFYYTYFAFCDAHLTGPWCSIYSPQA